MMDLSRGYVLVCRSLDKSNIFQNEKWLKVYIWCLIQANHKGKSVPVNTGKYQTVVKLERGQFIFGRNKAADVLNMKPSTVRNIMAKLEKLENLDIKKDNHFSIVTVLEYDFYQDPESYKGQPKDNQRTTKGQAKDTTNTHKQPNNEKNKDIILKPENVTEQTWNDFLTHRKNKKANVTQTVINTFIKESQIVGVSLENAMIECVSRGWTGFKAEWINNKKLSVSDHNQIEYNKMKNGEYKYDPNDPNEFIPDDTPF